MRKYKKAAGEDGNEDGVSQERWLVSYADFITLMFAFFAVLYATAEKDIEKSKEFQESIKKYLIKAGAFGESGQQINQGQKNNSPIEPPITTYKEGKPETVAVLDQAEAFLEAKLTKEERKKYIAEISTDDWGVRIVLPANALYASNSDKFKSQAMPFIEKLAALVATLQRKILIEGHVSIGEIGGAKSTWEFASQRAVNLLRFIQKKEKIAGERLASAALGDSRPQYSGAQTDLNSRIELVILNQDLEW